MSERRRKPTSTVDRLVRAYVPGVLLAFSLVGNVGQLAALAWVVTR